jgi:hypothetical protein
MPQPTPGTVAALVMEAGIARLLDWSSAWDQLALMERLRGRHEAAQQARDAAQWFHTVAHLARLQLEGLAGEAANEIRERQP